MFTGIVERMGRIVEYDLVEKWGRIVVDAEGWDHPVGVGESIAVQGICLTVAEIKDSRLRFDVLRETFEHTNLGEKKTGQVVNLERSLRWGDPMGGHVVIGHVDGVARVEKIDREGRDWSFTFACPPELMDGMVYKGAVGIDGVSLTIAGMTDDTITVHIIPFTYDVTTFGKLRVGDAANIEVDLLGKFVRRLVERGRAYPAVTWDALRKEGFLAV